MLDASNTKANKQEARSEKQPSNVGKRQTNGCEPCQIAITTDPRREHHAERTIK